MFSYSSCMTHHTWGRVLQGGGTPSLALHQNQNTMKFRIYWGDFGSCGKNRFTHVKNPHGTAMNQFFNTAISGLLTS